MSLAERIRDMRYAKGWGPDELARRAEISRTALYQIETGRTARPRAATLRRIAKALEVPLEDPILGPDQAPASDSQPPALHRTPERDDSAPSERAPPSLLNPTGVMAVSIASVEEARFASATEPPINNDNLEQIFSREGEMMSKLHDLLHSPIGHGVAQILEDLHGVLPRSRPPN
jgi:transcriptional regulator with XRE-family HTH domain